MPPGANSIQRHRQAFFIRVTRRIMSRRRPVGFIIIAIANFIVAVFFIACGVCSNVSEAKTTSWFIEINKVRFDDKKLTGQLKEKVPGYTPVKITGIVTGYCICVGLILAGVALLFG